MDLWLMHALHHRVYSTHWSLLCTVQRIEWRADAVLT
jgi:hypothetical protein